jgi:adenylate cyclase
LVEPVTRNLEVYNLYLKGMFFANKWTPDDVKKAMTFFQKAIEKEPEFALPYTGLSNCYAFLGATGQSPTLEVYPLARENALKALELNDTLYQSHLALGIVKFFYDWDWDGARQSFQKAVELSPGSAETHHFYGMFHSVLGNFHEAITELKIAVQLDPLSALINDTLTDTYYYAGRYDIALEQCRRTLELDPEFRSGVESLGSIYLMLGKNEKAIEAFEKLYHMTGHELKGVTGLGIAYATAGKHKKAQECIEKLEKRAKLDKDVHLDFDFALIYAALGEKDKAFKYLQQAVDDKVGAVLFLRSTPTFNELRTDKRFGKLLHQIGLEA